jgi:hypothetical protein
VYTTSLKFDSIVLIESLPPGELRTGRDLFESAIAPAAVNDPGLVAELYEPKTRAEFLGSLRSVAETARRHGSSPIVHIETHGDDTGIALSDGDLVSWNDIAQLLTVINQVSRMNLLVVAAMCHGWYMSDILRPTDRAPAFGIIGTRDLVSAGDLLSSMREFYQVLLRPGHDLRAALNAANRSESVEEWQYEMLGAELMLCRVFSHYVRSLSTEETQAQRVNRLVADLARAQSLDVNQTMQLRAAITQDLEDHESWFALYRSRFLMLDLFPENAPRFPLTYADCGGSNA